MFPAVAVIGPRQCGKSTLIKNPEVDLVVEDFFGALPVEVKFFC
jgi:predicted AAA+ superfamily ATPase